VGVHNQHIGRIYENCGIAITHRLRAGKSKVDAVGDILDLKQVGRSPGSRRLRPRRAAGRQAENRRSRKTKRHIPEKVAARNSVMAHNGHSSRSAGIPIFPVSDSLHPA